MSVLKIKNSQGEWEEVKTIVGPRGEKGFSPSARVIQDPDNFLTTIEITDENGTTSATIDLNGISQFLDSCIDDLASLTTIDTTEVESLTEV